MLFQVLLLLLLLLLLYCCCYCCRCCYCYCYVVIVIVVIVVVVVIVYCLLLGSQDGRIHVWSADTGEEVAILDGGHPHPSHCIQFNPKLMMMASACRSLVCV